MSGLDSNGLEDRMADGSLTPAVFGLVGTAVGSLTVMLSQWRLELLKQNAENKKRRSEKLQELVAALHELHFWIETLRRSALGESEERPPVPPHAKIRPI